MQRCFYNICQVVRHRIRQVVCFFCQLGKTENIAERFVQFVGHPSGQFADFGQPVGMPQLSLYFSLVVKGLLFLYGERQMIGNGFEQGTFFIEKGNDDFLATVFLMVGTLHQCCRGEYHG